jgi:hypothetical protein
MQPKRMGRGYERSLTRHMPADIGFTIKTTGSELKFYAIRAWRPEATPRTFRSSGKQRLLTKSSRGIRARALPAICRTSVPKNIFSFARSTSHDLRRHLWILVAADTEPEPTMHDTLPFSAHLTADGKYVNIRIPVNELPQALRMNPTRMNIRLMPETLGPSNARRWVPPFLLALKAS